MSGGSATALWTAEAIAAATGGIANSDFVANGVAFDSREVTDGDLFVALHGSEADGHDYVARALSQGAAGCLVDRPVDGPHVQVTDTTDGLVRLARASRARMTGKVIGVTGSVGKTGTKEALFYALDRSAPGAVHRSVKSYNNHVGVPLSLARMPATSRFAVLEMGMNHAGELSVLTRLVRPQVALVTAIAPAHIGHFGSEEAIADAKAEIFEGLEPGGTAILPVDSPHIARLYNKAVRHADKIVTFGFSRDADVRVVDHVALPTGGTMVTARVGEATASFTVAASGRHWVSNALAVLAAVEAVGGDLGAAGLALAELPGLPGRGARSTIRFGDGDVLLIDESYNANPASMAATIAQLGQEQTSGRRVVVLGAMKELGELSDSLHASLAEPIRAAGVAEAILVGDEMTPLARELQNDLVVRHVADTAAAIDALVPDLRAGDAVLVKGSNSIGLTKLVAAVASIAEGVA